MSGQENASGTPEKTFIERMAHEVGLTANANYIYATPVERDGVTVIPVAKSVYWFGGGGGRRSGEEGSGGGGGAVLKPIGYIEIAGGKTRFLRTRDPLAIAVAAAPAILFGVWRIIRLFRNHDKH